MPPPHAPRTVYTLRACTQPRSRHERASQDWVARRLASLCGWAYGGAYETRSAPAWHPYFVPDETLDLEQATRLGIQGEDDLFGGVVPHAFVASKVIMLNTNQLGTNRQTNWALPPNILGSGAK